MPRLVSNNNRSRHSRSLRLDRRADRHRMEGRLLGCRFWGGSFCFLILGYVVLLMRGVSSDWRWDGQS